MGKALYRTYRSKKLSEIVGQEHITTALERALKKGNISHAYLFTGPRGVGKTSIARILAHEINQLPYEDEKQHLDIIEIDAASNRRIDEIRDLRDKIHIAPAQAKYKVYIIDEVHMLTREAFNALLKTLEEPPAHVVFVLATTEAHKLPETIISRTQRYAFKPVERQKVAEHLKHIAKQEKINIDGDALELIAEHGEGSFRDSISLLDQMQGAGQKVTLADVQAALGIAPVTLIKEIIGDVAAHDAVAVAAHLQNMQQQGLEPAVAARQLGQTLRDMLTAGKSPLAPHDTLKLLARLVDVPASSDPKSYLEIALLDAAFDGAQPAKSAEKPSKIMPEEVRVKPQAVTEPHPSTLRAAAKVEPENYDTAPSTGLLNDAGWQQALAEIKKKHTTLYSILKIAQTAFEPGQITITTSTAFYKKRLNEPRNKQIIAGTIAALYGQKVAVSCQQSDVRVPPAPLPPASGEVVRASKPAPDKAALDTISNIFGGAEVLES